MARYRRSTVLDASLAEVWDVHASVEGLQSVTPDWTGLDIVDIRQPPGGTGTSMVEGTEIVIKLRPFGIVPGGRFVSRITALEEDDKRAMFRDELVSGPVPYWIHTHRFVDLGFGTLLFDQVDYELAGPLPGTILTPALSALFAYRHWRLGRQLG